MKEKRSLREQLEKMQDQMQRMDICLHFQELQRTSLHVYNGCLVKSPFTNGCLGFQVSILFVFFLINIFLQRVIQQE